MAKYSKKIVQRICELIQEDTYTVVEICQKVRISEATYYEWKANKAEFSEALEKANDILIDKMLIVAKKSLFKLVGGYEYDEKKTVTVNDGSNNPKIKEQTIIKKQVAPNLGAIIHLQTNKDPENWKNRQNTEVTGKDGKDLIPARILTKEEAEGLINKIEDDC